MDSLVTVAPPLPYLPVVLGTLMFTLLSNQVAPVDSCTCMPEHPQTMYCQAAWVIKAKVKTTRLITNPDYPKHSSKLRVYGVKISKVFKQGTHGFIKGRFVKLYTDEDSSMCGVHLNLNTTYYIQGHSNHDMPRINLCDNAQEWRTIPPVVKMGYRYLYKKNCQCTIGTSSGKDCIMDRRWTWKQKECYNENAACLPGRATNELVTFPSKHRACRWSLRGLFRRCMKHANNKDDTSSFEWEP